MITKVKKTQNQPTFCPTKQDWYSLAEAQLRLHKLKVTPLRIELMNLMSSLESPFSADSLYEDLKKKSVKTDLVTVYRNLNHFLIAEVIETAFTTHGTAYYLKICLTPHSDRVKTGKNSHLTSHHHHFIMCEGCGKVQKTAACSKTWLDFLQNQAKAVGFTLRHHNIELTGWCDACQPKDI